MSDVRLNNRLASAFVQNIRPPTNIQNQHAPSLNERILSEVFSIYTEKEIGFCDLGKMINVEVRVPRRKIMVMILGNHSAGKSSFINWYIDEKILRTGVAIEKQGYVFVVSGKKRETLSGAATLELYPHLQPLENFIGIDDLTTEISTSRARNFNLVTFIDTPGLVDGDRPQQNDFDTEGIFCVGDIADLVFVFFDPMGQALCKKTVTVIEKMSAGRSNKMRLFLAKADEAGSGTDQQRVLVQIVQELCKRPRLSSIGFEIPTIYLPGPTSKATTCVNHIEDACAIVEKTIEQAVQNALNTLGNDTKTFRETLLAKLKADNEARGRNFSRSVKSWWYGGLGIFLLLLLLLSLIATNVTFATRRAMALRIGRDGADAIYTVMRHLAGIWQWIPDGYHLKIITAILVVGGSLVILSEFFSSNEDVLSKRELGVMKRGLEFVERAAERKKVLYAEYLRQSLTEADL